MEDLRRQAIQAYLSLPKRGVEIGGLLFGEVRQDGSIAFKIDGCEDVPCEHRFGPSYKLSETDFDRLNERLARHPREGAAPVIGLYRSYTGRGANQDQTDLELVRNLFPQPHLVAIALLLQPVSAEKCMARFQFWSGELTAGRPYEPFLFEPAQLIRNSQAKPQPVETAAVSAEPAERLWEPLVESPKPVPVLPAPHAPHREWEEESAPQAPRRSRLWLPVLSCALAAVAGVAVYGFRTLERQPHWAPLGLDATASARDLLVSWDSATPALEQASHGVMSVTDGSAQNQIPLTAAQLRGGKLSYRPSHTNILFRLLVYDAGNRESGDSLRVANLHLAEPAPAPQAGAVQPPPTTPPDGANRSGTPAVARREEQPDIPEGIRARVRVRTVIPVQLQVNASGQVTGASAKGTGSGLDRYLADQAVKAARHWSFVPAHSKNGRAISSVKTVEFVFLPDGVGR